MFAVDGNGITTRSQVPENIHPWTPVEGIGKTGCVLARVPSTGVTSSRYGEPAEGLSVRVLDEQVHVIGHDADGEEPDARPEALAAREPLEDDPVGGPIRRKNRAW